MRFRSGVLIALGSSLVLGGCAAAAAGGAAGPGVSPTGKVYEPGTARPTESRFTAPAKLFIAQEQWEQALERAQAGIEAEPENPQHYYLAGTAYAGMGNVERANEMWRRAEEIYPAYELEIEPAREAAWVEAFNDGVRAYQAGNTEEAIASWTRANQLYPNRGEGYMNLAVLHTQQNDYDRAIEAYQQGIAALDREPNTRLLEEEEITDRRESRATMVEQLATLLLYTERFADAERLYRAQLEQDPDNVQIQANLASAIAQQGREAEAGEIYTRLLGTPNLNATDLFNIGVALFNAKDYPRAAEAFQRVTQAQPNSRDAWYNYANALYADKRFQDLIPVAQRLVELDPLNENAALILAQAYRETNQNQQALAALQRNQDAQVRIEDLQLRPGEGRSIIRGRIVGNRAAAGTPITLRFTFFSDTGEIGTQSVTVNAPAAEQSANFEVVLQNPTIASGYRYELVP